MMKLEFIHISDSTVQIRKYLIQAFHFLVTFGQTGTWISYNQKLYMFMNKAMIWQDARKHCRDSGGELVSIINENERDWVQSKVSPPLKLLASYCCWASAGLH